LTSSDKTAQRSISGGLTTPDRDPWRLKLDRHRSIKRLRHRLFSIPASIARTARQTLLHLSDRAPWAAVAVDAIHRLDRFRAPGWPGHQPPRPAAPPGPVEPRTP
jgi:hypothetical protein